MPHIRPVTTAAMALLAALALSPWSNAQPPENAATHGARAQALFEEGFYDLIPHQQPEAARQRFERAVAELNQALAVDPNNEPALRLLARIHTVEGRHAEAADAYRRMLALRPGDIDTRVALALALSEEGRFDDAIAELRQARSYTRDEGVLRRLDGYIGRLEQAR